MNARASSKHMKQLLREIYDRAVDERARKPTPAWAAQQRERFLRLLKSEAISSLRKLGAAAGTDPALFAAEGLGVVSTDLSPGMVQTCREKGLEGHAMDVTDLRFDDNSS